MSRLAMLNLGTWSQVPACTRLGACVGGVGNVVCIGLNYADHATEAGLKPPGQPIVFNQDCPLGAPSVLSVSWRRRCGHFYPLRRPWNKP